LHASTFAEDGYSAAIGCEALSLLTQKDILDPGMEQGKYLKQRLESLYEEFPQIISDVRGRGLMLAIEFSQEIKNICFEFRVFSEAQMIGYIIASALLHHENVRMAPSLSNGSTLRVQPTIFISRDEIHFFINALRRICLHLQSGNFTYFFEQLYPQCELKPLPAKLISADYVKTERPLAVFLCHLIDADHVKRVTPAFQNVPDATLEKRLALMKRAMEFGVYHAQTLTDREGKEIDIILMGIAMTSTELKKSFMGKGRSDLIAKVQRAVDYAKELGANTIGLGQFTSIVSGNGLYLDSRGMNLTTGNSYTIALAVEAATREAQNKNINLAAATVGLVGAAGNIVSVAAMLMADKVQKLVLIHHTSIEKSPKLIGVLKTILRESLQSESESSFNLWLKASLPASIFERDDELLSWMNAPETREHIVVTDDLQHLKECAIIITGASSGQGFLRPEHFGKDAVIVDVAVPANIKPDVLATLRAQRSDVTYLLGGIAKLPGTQSIVTPLFPLETNESFACMAETFAMGFSHLENIHHTGNLTKPMVMRSIEMAKEAGFSLGSIKEKNSL
jgi:predicted amino acid dehydrogenase